MAYKRRVRFVEPWFDEDLMECSRVIRAGARAAREELERDGLDPEDRRVERCKEIGSDGTELGGCVKFTLPLGGGISAASPRLTNSHREAGGHYGGSRSNGGSALRGFLVKEMGEDVETGTEAPEEEASTGGTYIRPNGMLYVDRPVPRNEAEQFSAQDRTETRA